MVRHLHLHKMAPPMWLKNGVIKMLYVDRLSQIGNVLNMGVFIGQS